MTRREISQSVRQLTVQLLGCNPARVHDDADFRTDLGGSPDGIAAMFAGLKSRFQISISDREMAFCQTVGTATDLVENKVELRRLVSGRSLRQ